MRMLACLAAGLAVAALTNAEAQKAEPADYPNRPIHVIVSVPAGGGVDTVTRLVGQKLQERLGQPVVIENRGGAGGNIGAAAVAIAPPDGYTLLATAPAPLAVNAALYKNLKYDPVAFESVAIMSLSPNVLVLSPTLAAKTTTELIAQAKANPRKLTYASQGNGTTSHLTAELFQRLTGTELVHVPYRGTAPALNDLIASQVDLMFVDVTAVLSLHQSGRARIVGIAAKAPLSELPEIATIEQQGVTGFLSATWNAVAAPAGTPPAITDRLNSQINATLGLPDVEAAFRELHLTRVGGTRADMTEFVNAERRRWGDVVRHANISID
jgi:tripartite-type tricarboxylate transporter receptor subunit TctC